MKSQARRGSGGWWRVLTFHLFTYLLAHCLLATGKSFVKKMAEVLDDARDEVGSTKPILLSTHHYFTTVCSNDELLLTNDELLLTTCYLLYLL